MVTFSDRLKSAMEQKHLKQVDLIRIASQQGVQQASFDFGFDAEDLPLMIEAIPSSADSIVLIITKVEDPEELDTRFSKFTPLGDSDTVNNDVLEKLQGADEFLDLLNKVKEAAAGLPSASPEEEQEEAVSEPQLTLRLFSFSTLDSVIRAARLAAPFYKNANTLYKDKENHTYILALAPGSSSDHEFNKICNMLSEYSTPEKADSTILAFLEEHCEIIVSADAVQKLAAL